MSIIEKLGIRRLEVFSTVNADGNIKVRFADLLEKETVYNEMLKALIRRVQTDYIYVQCGEIDFRDIESDVNIIEKATCKSWEEIKTIIED